jgi:hypothetical protein
MLSRLKLKCSRADSTCFSAQPFPKRSPVFELPATQNQQVSGMGFVVPKSTVSGTIVPLRMYVYTYTMNLLKVTPKLHSGGNSLGEISRLLHCGRHRRT